MDGFSGKRAVGGLSLSRSSGLSFKKPNQEDRSSQFCNHIGCSTRHSFMKSAETSIPEKPKPMKSPFHFKNSNSSAASYLRSSTSNLRKSKLEWKNEVSEADVAESSTRQNERGKDLMHDNGFVGREDENEGLQGLGKSMPILERFPKSPTEPSSSSSVSSGSRFGKQNNPRFGSAIHDTASSFLRRSSSPRTGTQALKTIPTGISDRPQRYGLRNLGCASISDVLPSGNSSSNGRSSRGVSVRRKFQAGEGSSSAILSLPGHPKPNEASSMTRNHSGRDFPVSVRTRRGSSTENTRVRLSEQEEEHIFQLPDAVLHRQLPRAVLSIHEAVQESSQRSFSDELPSVPVVGRPDSDNQTLQNRLNSRSEDRDDFRRFNIEGIAQVLLALERIEQDEELSYEQLLVLEANLFLGGLNFYDQHRDMRLDIDNMSYEELLALEEKMGTVSTALSEEALSKCLKRSIYWPSLSSSGFSCHGDDDDAKCIICQEEYVVGEEVGRLQCDHRFHVDCIREWLRLKNWCPICKTAAASQSEL
ncbi:hypothetical protein HPP92_010538 [Vanilla planifolia]|uniref:RING-type E3 ubiquitin transferase n=1 Tax=Vanilla planifolia TaxID=51239 RepID=A0A835V063_VANPL|nr:hypothetical protein HPP92_010538 [Vanilla planifolia]